MNDLDILFEDNHLLVVNKPAVLATMGVKATEPSLLNYCKDYLKKKYSKPGNVYLGVVSRLDSFVTGAIVFARTSKAAARLSQQFQQREVEKKYAAIVSGQFGDKPGHQESLLEDWIVKNDQRRRMVVVPQEAKGAKHAQLRFKQLAQIEEDSETLSLLEIELLTGRKHQIRVQFSSRGMPIAGDRKYESKIEFAKGIALHAQLLAFNHPTTKSRITIRCEPPKYWKLARFAV